MIAENGNKVIALVIPSLGTGGMERVMSELAGYFSRQSNLEVHLIVLSKNEVFFDLSKKVIVHKPKQNKTIWFLYAVSLYLFLRKKIKEIRPDVILSFGEMYNSFVLLASYRLNVNVFVSDRSKPDKSWGYVHEQLRKILYKKATGIISQTKYSKDYLTLILDNKNIKVIPNPVDIHKVVYTTRKNVILTVGRLIKSKRIDLLLEIFSEIDDNDWVLWVVGDGPEEASLHQLANDLGLSDKVIFWGVQKDVDKFYCEAKIFTFTSVSEGFPNALLEAMSYGLACVSFDCIAGPSDLIVDGSNGYLIQLYDKKNYVNKLKLLLSDTILIQKISLNAVDSVKKYSLDQIGKKYIDFMLYEKTVK